MGRLANESILLYAYIIRLSNNIIEKDAKRVTRCCIKVIAIVKLIRKMWPKSVQERYPSADKNDLPVETKAREIVKTIYTLLQEKSTSKKDRFAALETSALGKLGDITADYVPQDLGCCLCCPCFD